MMYIYKMVLTFESVHDEISLKCDYSSQIKATEQGFPVTVLFIMMYKLVLAFESVDEIMKCDYSNKNC